MLLKKAGKRSQRITAEIDGEKNPGPILPKIEKGNCTRGHQTDSKYKISKIVAWYYVYIYDFERSQKLLISVAGETVSNLQFSLPFLVECCCYCRLFQLIYFMQDESNKTFIDPNQMEKQSILWSYAANCLFRFNINFPKFISQFIRIFTISTWML